jgi:hypothetical protein
MRMANEIAQISGLILIFVSQIMKVATTTNSATKENKYWKILCDFGDRPRLLPNPPLIDQQLP